ncbi:MAG TPA: hypothetical protein VHM65_05655, partial [Candidatus Lustribacter sp.]|nr:hypothetical protein [Candidatus Lustribacter sp.]
MRILDGPEPLSIAAERARIRVLLALSSAEFERSGRRAALPVLRAAVEAARAVGDDELTALAHSQRAMVLARSGDLGAALDALDRAADSVDALGPRDQCVLLNNRGMLMLHRGEISTARAEFGRSRQIAARHGLNRQEFMAVHNLGHTAYLAGDLAAALELMAEADRIDTDVSRAAAWHDQGRVLLDAGLISEAAQRLREAAALGAERRQQHVHSEIELDLARALALLGEPSSAAALARRAQAVFARRRAPVWAARAQLVALGIELPRSRRPRSIALTARRVAERAGLAGDPALVFDARLLEADAWLAAGAVVDAEGALAQVQSSTSLTPRLHRSLVEATLHASRGEQTRAATVLRTAATDLRRAQSRTASLDLRTATAVHGVQLAVQDMHLALARSPSALLASTERWRSATGRLPSVRAADPAVAELMASLRDVQEQIRRGAPSLDVLDRAAQLQREIREHGWTAAAQPASGRERQPLGVSRLREALLEDGSDLVSFAVVGDTLVGVGIVGGRVVQPTVASAERVRQTCLRAATDLAAAASFHLGPLWGPVWGSLEATLAELDRV